MGEEPHSSIKRENVERGHQKEPQIIISVASTGDYLAQSNTGLLSWGVWDWVAWSWAPSSQGSARGASSPGYG